MEYPHWLMIGGALFLVVGLVGTAFQRKQAAANPSSLEQAGRQPISLSEFHNKADSAVVGPRGDKVCADPDETIPCGLRRFALAPGVL